MEHKSNKKSSYHQLQALVEYMEEHPDFARGTAVYGSSKMTTEEQWMQLVKKLNSLGPPVRTIAEWKKTWADFKSRTKKKIAENKKSLRETGGGMYRMCNLTELEQIVDRTVGLTKSAAPTGGNFGYPDCNNSKAVDHTIPFQLLKETPPRSSTVVAVITPTRIQQKCKRQSTLSSNLCDTQCNITSVISTENDWFIPLDENIPQQQTKKSKHSETDDELPGFSSGKKLKAANEKVSLIRRQVRLTEASAARAKEQTEAAKTLAEATKALVVAVTRMADAIEIQTKAVQKNADTQAKILTSIDAFRSELANYFLNK